MAVEWKTLVSKEISIYDILNQSAAGFVSVMTAGENLSFGDLCYRKSDGKWWKANAGSATTMPGCVVSLGTILTDDTGEFALPGSSQFIRNDSWSLTVGGLIYASTTSGGITQTAPSSTGDQVQVIGYAYTSTIINFDPSLILVEVG